MGTSGRAVALDSGPVRDGRWRWAVGSGDRRVAGRRRGLVGPGPSGSDEPHRLLRAYPRTAEPVPQRAGVSGVHQGAHPRRQVRRPLSPEEQRGAVEPVEARNGACRVHGRAAHQGGDVVGEQFPTGARGLEREQGQHAVLQQVPVGSRLLPGGRCRTGPGGGLLPRHLGGENGGERGGGPTAPTGLVLVLVPARVGTFEDFDAVNDITGITGVGGIGAVGGIGGTRDLGGLGGRECGVGYAAGCALAGRVTRIGVRVLGAGGGRAVSPRSASGTVRWSRTRARVGPWVSGREVSGR